MLELLLYYGNSEETILEETLISLGQLRLSFSIEVSLKVCRLELDYQTCDLSNAMAGSAVSDVWW